MTPASVLSAFGRSSWAQVFGGAFLAIVVLFVVFPFLQRRFKVFTRGTISFIVSVLMIFTVIDGLDYLSDIRIMEGRLRREARQAGVSSMLRSYFVSGPDAALDQVPYNLHRDSLAESLREFDRDLCESLGEDRGEGKSPRDFTLISLDVGRDLVSRLRILNPSHYRGEEWGFEALLDGGDCFLRVMGLARLKSESEGHISIMDVQGDFGPAIDCRSAEAADVFRRARGFKSPDYGIDGSYWEGLLVRAAGR